jgi:hypothetical protein
MPSYEFLNTKTGRVEEHVMSVSSYDSFKEQNPHLERYYSEAPTLSYSGSGDAEGRKTDNTWKEVMAKIGEKHPASPLADKYVRKKTKDIKTKQILEKHRKRLQQKG